MKEAAPFNKENRSELEVLLEKGRKVLRWIREQDEQVASDDKERRDPKISRRAFLGGLGMVGVAGALGVAGKLNGVEEFKNEFSFKLGEAKEERKEAPRFFAEVSGFEARMRLRFDEVQFVDEHNRPIGGPTKLEEFIIEREDDNGVKKPYLLSPGPVDEIGITTEGIAGEWLNEMRRRIRQENPHLTDIGVLTVDNNFRAALNETDEPALVAQIVTGEVVTFKDIVDYFASKPVVGAEEYSRMEYLTKFIVFESWNEEEMSGVPLEAVVELRKLVVGLCAQESGFNNDLTSSAGAKGIFQFMPVTWEENGGQPEEISSFKKQVEIAGKYLSTIYRQVQHHAGEKAMEILKKLHDKETLARDVLAPLAINSYNAGASRVGEAVEKYFSVPENIAKKLIGKDLFLDIAEFARKSEDGLLSSYGDDAREYVTRIYANAIVLEKK